MTLNRNAFSDDSTPSAALILMPGMTYEWLAQDLVLNGVPASLRRVHVDAPFDEVVAHYTSTWQSTGGVIDRQYGGWRVLATKEKDRFISIQLKAEGQQTQGILTVSADPLEHSADYRGELPLPRELTVASWQTHLDGASTAQTITLASSAAVGYVRASLVQSFQADGWRIVDDQAAVTMNDGHRLRFKSDKGEARVTIGRDARWSENTLVLIVWKQS